MTSGPLFLSKHSSLEGEVGQVIGIDVEIGVVWIAPKLKIKSIPICLWVSMSELVLPRDILVHLTGFLSDEALMQWVRTCRITRDASHREMFERMTAESTTLASIPQTFFISRLKSWRFPDYTTSMFMEIADRGFKICKVGLPLVEFTGSVTVASVWTTDRSLECLWYLKVEQCFSPDPTIRDSWAMSPIIEVHSDAIENFTRLLDRRIMKHRQGDANGEVEFLVRFLKSTNGDVVLQATRALPHLAKNSRTPSS